MRGSAIVLLGLDQLVQAFHDVQHGAVDLRLVGVLECSLKM